MKDHVPVTVGRFNALNSLTDQTAYFKTKNTKGVKTLGIIGVRPRRRDVFKTDEAKHS